MDQGQAKADQPNERANGEALSRLRMTLLRLIANAPIDRHAVRETNLWTQLVDLSLAPF